MDAATKPYRHLHSTDSAVPTLPFHLQATTDPDTFTPILECPNEVLIKILTCNNWELEELEAIRLVCRRFRDCAWDAFGEHIKDTTFDMCKAESMERLWDISQHPVLSNHIKSLSLVAYPIAWWIYHQDQWEKFLRFIVDDDNDYDLGLHNDIVQIDNWHDEFMRFDGFFPSAWTLEWNPPTESVALQMRDSTARPMHDINSPYSPNEQRDLIEYISIAISSLTQLRHVSYVGSVDPFDDDRQLCPSSTMESIIYSWTRYDGQYSDIMAVGFLLRALVHAKVFPSTLKIPLIVHRCNAMGVFLVRSELLTLLKCVKSLHITQHESVFKLPVRMEDVFEISAETAPHLTELCITGLDSRPDQGESVFTTTSFPPPPDFSYPALTVLRLEWVHFEQYDYMDLINAVRQSLRHFSIDDCDNVPWLSLLMFLSNLSLSSAKFQKSRPMLPAFDTATEELLKSVADTVYLSQAEEKDGISTGVTFDKGTLRVTTHQKRDSGEERSGSGPSQ